jgi:hypothetical protein
VPFQTDDNNLGRVINFRSSAHEAADAGISDFLDTWPPSSTPVEHFDWITASHGNHSEATQEDREQLKADFDLLVAAGRVTQDDVMRLARIHHILSGKYMIYQRKQYIDELWGNVVRKIVPKQGYAKVSTVRHAKDPVCCVNVRDFDNEYEMQSVREELRKIMVQKKIIFKPDALTFLDLYEGNKYGIEITFRKL